MSDKNKDGQETESASPGAGRAAGNESGRTRQDVLGGDQLAALLQRMEQLEAVQEENELLRERLTLQAQQHERELGQFHAPVTVNVKTPCPAPRLGIFTGLKPSGGAEVSFTDWHDRVSQYLQEANNEEDTCRRVKASLRGVAANQTKNCISSSDVLKTLTEIYGSVKTEEDLYAQFVRMELHRGETLPDFFSRVWHTFTDLNKNNTYGEDIAHKKIYHTFMSSAQRHQLVIVELRSEFGLPGTASPDPAKVLRRLREMGEESSQTSAGRSVQSAAAAVDVDYDRLATLVADKLRGSPSFQQQQQSAPKGPCYRCGEIGTHYRRDCKNAPNPQRVAEAKRRYRKQPLNG